MQFQRGYQKMNIKLFFGIGFIIAAIGWLVFSGVAIPTLVLPWCTWEVSIKNMSHQDIPHRSAVMSVRNFVRQRKEAIRFMSKMLDAIIVNHIFQETSWLLLVMVKQRRNVHAVLRLGWRESMSVWVWKDWRTEISNEDFDLQRQEFEEIYR